MSCFLFRQMERVTGIEPVSRAWQARVIATIRYPHFFLRGPGGNRTHTPVRHSILSAACIPVPPLDQFVEMMGVEPMSNRFF